MYQHILVPVQNDMCSQVAAKHVFDLSRLLGSQVTLLHVQFGDPQETELEHPHAWLTELASSARIKPRIRVVSGDSKTITQAILEFAQGENVDLIVMGTHGREGAERLRLGSVAQAVASS